MKTARELRKMFDQYETRFGADAPVAMLIELRRARNAEDSTCALLAALIRDELARRAVEVFAAREDSSSEQIFAYQECCDRVRSILGRALCIESMQPTPA